MQPKPEQSWSQPKNPLFAHVHCLTQIVVLERSIIRLTSLLPLPIWWFEKSLKSILSPGVFVECRTTLMRGEFKVLPKNVVLVNHGVQGREEAQGVSE